MVSIVAYQDYQDRCIVARLATNAAKDTPDSETFSQWLNFYLAFH